MTYREWATPLTIGSFLVIAVTGVLMFFHLDSGLNKLAHEWLAWAMLAAVGLHAAVHFKSFSRYFTRPRHLR
jgi:cytochrome b561